MEETILKVEETLEKIKEYAGRIKVMSGWLVGKKILVKYVGDPKVYELVDSPSWDWSKARYYAA